jgi:signal transduction histidine kinase
MFGGPQASPWLYNFWRVGFAVAVVGYAWIDGEPTIDKRMSIAPASAIGWCLVIVLALLLAIVAAVTVGEEYLPVQVSDAGHYSPLSQYNAALTLTLTALALVLLWVRQRSLLDLSLMVVTSAFAAELGVNLFVTSRFSFGFYASRAFSLVTSVAVLALLVSEIARLYARLARANMLLERERDNKLMNARAITAAIAHEVSQPLGAIELNGEAGLDFLNKTPPDLDEIRSVLNDMISAGRRTSEVIGDIQTLFGKVDQGREPVDVNALILKILRSLGAELQHHGIETSTELTPELPFVDGNSGQLQEVIYNLVHNAVEAMAITSRARLLRVRTELQGRDAIAIAVEDTGPGIEPTKLSSIFDAFTTTKSHGMGLGLAICRMISEHHGGQLTASSDGKSGSLFLFVLPIASTNKVALAKQARERP